MNICIDCGNKINVKFLEQTDYPDLDEVIVRFRCPFCNGRERKTKNFNKK